MRKSLIAAAVAASFITSAAFAAGQIDTGPIKTLDTAKHQLTLADGKVFELPAAWQSTGFKVGDKVKVSYEMQGAKMIASAVDHAS